jgi:DNA polymerase I-like protein with 3'-5' exonuclease and polymerase domains
MASYVFDIETDGLLDTLTKIHCLVLRDVDTGEVFDFRQHDAREGVLMLNGADRIIGHNIIKFDIPAIQKIYPWFNPMGEIIDTLVCTRLIWSDIRDADAGRVKRGVLPGKLIGAHGLEAWGYRLGLQKGEYVADFKAAAGDGYVEGSEWWHWSQEMHDYCILDTEVTLALWKRIEAKQYSAQALELEHGFATILAMMERYGFAFDKAAAATLYQTLVTRRLAISEELKVAFPARYEAVETRSFKRGCRRWVSSPIGSETRLNKKQGVFETGCYSEESEGAEFTRIDWVAFNPSSRHHIARRLKEMGWEPQEFTPEGSPKVDETILEKLPYPQAKVLAEHFLVEKRIGQLAEGDQAWLRLERKGRIHGSVNPNGAVTGRCTHSNPNVAQVPRVGSPYGHDCRALFGVSSGRVLVGADLSGLELRCLAHFMARYDGGEYGRILLEGDIHWANVIALGLTTEDRDDTKLIHKLFRNAAKTFIYAFLYGAGDEKIGLTIYELVILEARKNNFEGWEDLQKKFFGTTGEVSTETLKAAGKKLKTTFMRKTPALKKLKDAVTQAAARGWIKGLDGRQLAIRSSHAALNTLLQSAGALIAKQATVFASQELSTLGYVWGKDWALVAHVHDEMQTECRKDIADVVGRVFVQSMQRAGEHFGFRLPIDGEFKVGRNWAETH